MEDATNMEAVIKSIGDVLTQKHHVEEEIQQSPKEVQEVPQSYTEIQSTPTFDNPDKTWESLADKISKQFN